MEFPCDEIHVSSDEETNNIADEQPNTDSYQKNIQECIGTQKPNVNEAKSAIYVHRKLLWEDYVDVSKRSKWFDPENTLKVNFIGEKVQNIYRI